MRQRQRKQSKQRAEGGREARAPGCGARSGPWRGRAGWAVAVALLGIAAPLECASALSVTDPGQAPVALADPGATGPSELSGLTYDPASGRYWAVSDGDSRLFRLAVAIDPGTGAITSAQVDATLALRGPGGAALPAGADLEGVALAPSRASVFVSDESGPRVREHRLSDGWEVAQLSSASSPALSVFGNVRPNLGWESLSVQAGDTVLWTANEEALSVDGPTSQTSGGAGTTVRLQRIGVGPGSSFTATGQWAYLVDGDPVAGWLGVVNAGVSDVVALPDGRLLVLERAAGIVANPLGLDFRSRLYLVDLAGATDVTPLGSLAAGGYTAVGKTLLWERVFPDDNIEAIALGPALPGGGIGLLLASDDGSGQHQGLVSLVLHGVPEPGSGTLLGLGLAGLAARRRSARGASRAPARDATGRAPEGGPARVRGGGRRGP